VKLPGLKQTSGRECIKILCKHFGFAVVRQRGSHIVLRKEAPPGSIGTVVPDHKELKLGTLTGILALAQVDKDEFAKYQ